MAVLQKQFTRYPQRPAAKSGIAGSPIKLPVNHRRYRAYSRASERNLRRSLMTAAALSSLLVAYIAGHAKMTSVNYQRVQILNQTRDLTAQNSSLTKMILRRTDEATVDAWAKAHGMVSDSSEAFVLHR